MGHYVITTSYGPDSSVWDKHRSTSRLCVCLSLSLCLCFLSVSLCLSVCLSVSLSLKKKKETEIAHFQDASRHIHVAPTCLAKLAQFACLSCFKMSAFIIIVVSCCCLCCFLFFCFGLLFFFLCSVNISSLSVSVSLSVCLSVCLSLSLCVCFSASVGLSVCLCASLSVCLSPCISLSVCVSLLLLSLSLSLPPLSHPPLSLCQNKHTSTNQATKQPAGRFFNQITNRSID